MHKATLRVVGGSVMVTIPRPYLQDLGWVKDSQVGMSIDHGRLVIEKPRYTLAQLMAQCNLSAPVSDDEKTWDAIQPEGREVF
jgi:antitoxin ChpS